MAKTILKTNNPDTHPDFLLVEPTGNKISVETARDIASFLSFAVAEAERKVVIILNCHKGTVEFQQAILKLLEDNAERCSFLITAEKELLPTIHSRCYTIPVRGWDFSRMMTWIVKNQLAINETALSLADGRPGLYRELIKEESFLTKTERFIKDIESAPQKAVIGLGALEEGYYEENKERESLLIGFIEKYFSAHLLDEKALSVNQMLTVMDLCSEEQRIMGRSYGKTENFRFYRKLQMVLSGN